MGTCRGRRASHAHISSPWLQGGTGTPISMMSFICCMGRFWGLAEDKMLVPALVWDQDPMAQRGVCLC